MLLKYVPGFSIYLKTLFLNFVSIIAIMKVFFNTVKKWVPYLPISFAGLAAAAFTGCKQRGDAFDEGIHKINHVVVIYMENHSFDNLYGQFEGANGLLKAPQSAIRQLDLNNVMYDTLPAVPFTCEVPVDLPNSFFNIDQYIHSDRET